MLNTRRSKLRQNKPKPCFMNQSMLLERYPKSRQNCLDLRHCLKTKLFESWTNSFWVSVIKTSLDFRHLLYYLRCSCKWTQLSQSLYHCFKMRLFGQKQRAQLYRIGINIWTSGKSLKGQLLKLHSLDKKLNFLFFIWCANLAKHLVKR